MRATFLTCLVIVTSMIVNAQPSRDTAELTLLKSIDHTDVKNQGSTGTCWSFSTISLVESQTMKNEHESFDLSEMFIARNIYIEKAKNYLLRQGHTQFGEGGLGNDVINAIAKYGVVPESIYSGMLLGQQRHDHSALVDRLKSYLDNLLANRPIPANWVEGFDKILDDNLGKAPETFTYREKVYTPRSFASEVLKFKKDDYVMLTSFTHHPFYEPFVVEIPDNYSSSLYYNVPLNDLIALTEKAVEGGFSVMWDADVSNASFRQKNEGYAMMWKDPKNVSTPVNPDEQEQNYSPAMRQELFENLTTQDDHLMHIVGLEKSKGGKKFFLVKNSWGEIGPYKGYIHVSEAYFAINTITLVVPKAAIDAALKTKLALK